KDESPAEVEIFYEKDLMTNPDGNVPNWFYYWKQSPIITNILTIPGIHLYNLDAYAFADSATPLTLSLEYDGKEFPVIPKSNSTYGANEFAVMGRTRSKEIGNEYLSTNSPLQRVVYEYEPYFNKIIIGEGCGFSKAAKLCPSPSGSLKGIHAF